MDILIKICGMRDPDNIREVLTLNPDFIGFIFYPKSPRYVASPETLNNIRFGQKTQKTGVFVNASLEEIMQKVKLYDLQAVQLHGEEPVSLCCSLKNRGLMVLKAFQIHSEEDFNSTSVYNHQVDYFLFDAKTISYGGSGSKFDWSLLDAYQGDTPFFLSGGIASDDLDAIKKIRHPGFRGIDLNSRFETAPAIKNYMLLQQFIKQLKQNE
ncbi:MAG: phosphoribosylanthranilate isomerase [Paludibacter sp.]|nr:phosphoribosylanthranilate isomerase [Paludibacter sp.]MDD4199461.1 phosphoribosylanthranilate isomerase [Paludibacter sp.]MDD4428720.1 phosphoribosylanthranilate isomerase [Paludibacter sp.]